jgi:hypothetical protein
MQDLTKGSFARNLIPFIRTVAIVLPALAFSRMSGFALHWIWYLAVGCVLLQMTLNRLFLHREYRRRVSLAPAALRIPG